MESRQVREEPEGRPGAKISGVEAPVASAAFLGPSPPRMPNHNGPYAESGFSNSDALAGPTAPGLGALAQQPEGSPSVPASSTTAAAVARRRGPKLRVIANYNPSREPEHGYLGVDEGSIVVVMRLIELVRLTRTLFVLRPALNALQSSKVSTLSLFFSQALATRCLGRL